MIDNIIHDQKTIVDVLYPDYGDWLILTVMLLNIHPKLPGTPLSDLTLYPIEIIISRL